MMKIPSDARKFWSFTLFTTFFWVQPGTLVPPKHDGAPTLSPVSTRRFDVRYEQKIELPHVATLVNGLANAVGENGHTESDDGVHSYELHLEVLKQFECRFQAPTPVGVGWKDFKIQLQG